MRTLVPILAISLILAAFSDYQSLYVRGTFGEKKYIRKDKFFFAIMTITMAVFVGLRTRGNDTYTYRQMYEALSVDMSSIFSVKWTDVADAPGLQFVCAWLKRFGATTQDYFMLFALVTVCIYLWFIRKYTSDIWLSVYFFITMGVYTFTMAAIKQTVAVAFLLIATDRAIEKKYGRFIVWFFIAELFHPYAFIYLIVPFLFFNPWTERTWLLIGGTIVIALSLSKLMGGILSMTDALGGSYDEDAFIGEGVNIFRVLVVWVPVFISYLARRSLRKNDDRATNLIINLTMVNALIMFIGLFGTANYFARLANYFLIFQTLSLPWLFRFFERKSRRMVTAASAICFFFYFYYSNVLANGAFDSVYSFITFPEFFKQLF